MSIAAHVRQADWARIRQVELGACRPHRRRRSDHPHRPCRDPRRL